MKQTAKTARKTSDRTAYRMKPGKPSPRTSQSGYGHKSSTGGTVAREATRARTETNPSASAAGPSTAVGSRKQKG